MAPDLRALWLLVATCAVGLGATFAVFALTPAGQVLDDWALIGNAEISHEGVKGASRLLHHITPGSAALLAIVIVVVGLLDHRLRTGLVCGLGFAIAVTAAEVLKRLPERPELDSGAEGYLVDKTIDTFPSGHVTIVTSFVLALLIAAPGRSRTWVAALGSALVACVGMGVVIAGWHRPSDSVGGVLLGAGVIGMTSIVLVSRSGSVRAVRLSRREVGAATFMVSVLAGFVLLVSRPGTALPEGVAPLAFPVAMLLVASICLVVVQVSARLLCLPVPGAVASPRGR